MESRGGVGGVKFKRNMGEIKRNWLKGGSDFVIEAVIKENENE